MTEDEAKTKWCPMARVTGYSSDAAAHNRWKAEGNRWGTPVGSCCIGSECMAWRWTGNPHGYCGLASKA